MSSLHDDDSGPNTPGSAGAARLAYLYKLIFVSVSLLTGWLMGTTAALYFCATSTEGTFTRDVAVSVLSLMILLLAAPLLFSLLIRKGAGYRLAVVAAAVAIVALGTVTDGIWRALLINLGTGACFIVAIDLNIMHRFREWSKRQSAVVQDAVKDIHAVL